MSLPPLDQALEYLSRKLEHVVKDFLKEYGLPEDVTIRIEVPTDTY